MAQQADFPEPAEQPESKKRKVCMPQLAAVFLAQRLKVTELRGTHSIENQSPGMTTQSTTGKLMLLARPTIPQGCLKKAPLQSYFRSTEVLQAEVLSCWTSFACGICLAFDTIAVAQSNICVEFGPSSPSP